MIRAFLLNIVTIKLYMLCSVHCFYKTLSFAENLKKALEAKFLTEHSPLPINQIDFLCKHFCSPRLHLPLDIFKISKPLLGCSNQHVRLVRQETFGQAIFILKLFEASYSSDKGVTTHTWHTQYRCFNSYSLAVADVH